jgi:hypothetical protein
MTFQEALAAMDEGKWVRLHGSECIFSHRKGLDADMPGSVPNFEDWEAEDYFEIGPVMVKGWLVPELSGPAGFTDADMKSDQWEIVDWPEDTRPA